jgi:hypothetical protein
VTDDQLPDDPFSSGLGPRFDDFVSAGLIWALLLEMTVEEAGKTIRAMNRTDLQGLVLEKIVCARLGADFGRDGSVGWEREDPPERGDDEPEDGSG